MLLDFLCLVPRATCHDVLPAPLACTLCIFCPCTLYMRDSCRLSSRQKSSSLSFKLVLALLIILQDLISSTAWFFIPKTASNLHKGHCPSPDSKTTGTRTALMSTLFEPMFRAIVYSSVALAASALSGEFLQALRGNSFT